MTVNQGVTDSVTTFPAEPFCKYFSCVLGDGVEVQGVSVPAAGITQYIESGLRFIAVRSSILIPFFFTTCELGTLLFLGAIEVVTDFLALVTPGPKTFWVTGGGWEEEEEEEVEEDKDMN